MSAFDTARDIRLPGVVIRDAYIDPMMLSSRMKNMVKSMLRTGIIKGGWNSKSKQLAQKIAEGRGVMLFQTSSRGFYAPDRSSYGDATIDEVCHLIDADMTLELVNDAEAYATHGHKEAIMQRTRTRHEESKRTVRTNQLGRWCWMHSDEITQQIGQVFAALRSPAQIENAEKLCDMLDRGDHIPITISGSN